MTTKEQAMSETNEAEKTEPERVRVSEHTDYFRCVRCRIARISLNGENLCAFCEAGAPPPMILTEARDGRFVWTLGTGPGLGSTAFLSTSATEATAEVADLRAKLDEATARIEDLRRACEAKQEGLDTDKHLVPELSAKVERQRCDIAAYQRDADQLRDVIRRLERELMEQVDDEVRHAAAERDSLRAEVERLKADLADRDEMEGAEMKANAARDGAIHQGANEVLRLGLGDLYGKMWGPDLEALGAAVDRLVAHHCAIARARGIEDAARVAREHEDEARAHPGTKMRDRANAFSDVRLEIEALLPDSASRVDAAIADLDREAAEYPAAPASTAKGPKPWPAGVAASRWPELEAALDACQEDIEKREASEPKPAPEAKAPETVTRHTLLERLAAQEHERWSGWMKYLFSKCDLFQGSSDNGPGPKRLLIPAWAVERWERQANASYAGLSEQEKESDRKEARKTLALLASDGAVTLSVEVVEQIREALTDAPGLAREAAEAVCCAALALLPKAGAKKNECPEGVENCIHCFPSAPKAGA